MWCSRPGCVPPALFLLLLTSLCRRPTKERRFPSASPQNQRPCLQQPNQELPSFVIVFDTRFLYDGWNLVAEFEMNLQSQILNLKSTYAWGLDLSGTEQGAGGVGGLLFAVNHSALSTLNSELTAQAPCYDGNGNITARVSLADNNIQLLARYEYDAFGKVVLKDENNLPTGTKLPPFGFSTKYTDEETALCYYGYRYYAPEMGRWLNKDPIGERGGTNLYGMVHNDPVNWIDFLGLAKGPEKCEAILYVGHHWENHPHSEITKLLEDLKKDNYQPPCGSGMAAMGCGATDANATVAGQYPDNAIPMPYLPHHRPIEPKEVRPIIEKNWDEMKKHIQQNQCKEKCCNEVLLKVECTQAAKALLKEHNEASICYKHEKIPCTK